MRTILLWWLVVGLFSLSQVVFSADSKTASRVLPDGSKAPGENAGTKVAGTSRLIKAQSARSAGDRDQAISLYKELVMLEPDNVDARLALASTLGEAGRFDEARSELNSIQKMRPAWLQLYMTRARIEQQAQNEVSALKAFSQALALDPGNRSALEGKLLTLSRLGSTDIAITEAKEFPGLDPEVVQRLYEDKAAQAIRHSENTYHDTVAEALPAQDAAIELIEQNLKNYPGSERSRFDYVRALANRNRHRDAIRVYASLVSEKRSLPGYLHYSAGQAYLAEQQPERAREAFHTALRIDPNDFNASVGLFYALCDLNKFKRAKVHIDALVARQHDPEKKFQAEMLSIWARAYEDRLSVAQDRFHSLQTRVPASTALHNALGRVYLWRGWPRRAGKEFSYVAVTHPDDMESQIGLLDVEKALGDFRSAARRVSHLNMTSDGSENVKRLNRKQYLHHRPELNFSIGTSQNKERASTGQSLHLDTRAYSALIDFQNRIFAHQYYESTRFNTRSAYYKRLGLGWESTIASRGKLEIEVQQESFKDNQTSLILGGEILLNDYWRARSRYDSNSIDVPLRARVNDIAGRSVSLGSKYRPHERAVVDVGVQDLAMTDGNDRRNLFASAEYQFIQGPFYKANIALEVNLSSNTRKDTDYFNPAKDQTTQLTLKNEWAGYRRYTRSFYQRLSLSAGAYTQQGFGVQTIGSFRYEHEWNINDALNARYGLAYVRRVYDGEPSIGPEAMLSVNRKF